MHCLHQPFWWCFSDTDTHKDNSGCIKVKAPVDVGGVKTLGGGDTVRQGTRAPAHRPGNMALSSGIFMLATLS